MAGRTYLADNMVKEKTFIDKDGNKIVGPTPRGWDNTIIEYAQSESLEAPGGSTAPIEGITKEEHEAEQQANQEDKTAEPENPLAAMVREKVQSAVAEALKDLDIKGMVQEAIKEAFKG